MSERDIKRLIFKSNEILGDLKSWDYLLLDISTLEGELLKVINIIIKLTDLKPIIVPKILFFEWIWTNCLNIDIFIRLKVNKLVDIWCFLFFLDMEEKNVIHWFNRELIRRQVISRNYCAEF